MKLTLRIKIDTTSWLMLSGALIALILSIVLIVTARYNAPIITSSLFTGFLFKLFYDRIRGKQSKPEYNKYEITLFALIIGIMASGMVLFYVRILNIMGYFLVLLAVIALMLISYSYRSDRKTQWEKEQQTLTPLTLQK
jgi:hypothetical protein